MAKQLASPTGKDSGFQLESAALKDFEQEVDKPQPFLQV